MKPTFALDLSRDAIALLHRTPKGWTSLGEVAFDAPDLPEALDYLRKTALGVSPLGLACKIILPNSQILYTEVSAPGPSRNDKRRQIAEALEGRTPYPVEDLAFDWSGKGAVVKVAVVARETLSEAEGFATTHRLNPVSFVAIPPEGTFVGEAWFGPSAAAESLLAPGEVVDRDREVVTILQRDLPGAEAATVTEADVDAAVQAAAPPIMPDAAAVAPAARSVAPDDDLASLPGLQEALGLEPRGTDPEVPVPDMTAEVPAEVPEAGPEAGPEAAGVDAAEVALARALADVPAAASGPAATLAATAEPLAVDARQGEAPLVEEAPFAHVTDTGAFPDEDDPAPVQTDPDKTAKDKAAKDNATSDNAAKDKAASDDVPPAPSTVAVAAFASRRSTGGPDTAAPVISTGKADLRPGQPIPRPTPPKGLAGSVTATSIPGTRAKPKARIAGTEAAVASLGGNAIPKSPARPGGTFGAVAPPRNRTGVVFLVLVALLLLFLAVIAAWSTLWLSGNGTVREDAGQVIDGVVPGVDDEMLADMQDPEGMTAPLPEADQSRPVNLGALATEDVPITLALEEPLTAAGEQEVALGADDAGAVDAGDIPLADVVGASSTAPASPSDTPAAAPALAAAPAPEPLAESVPEPAPETAVATDLTAAQAPAEDQDEIFLAAMDAPPPALDALALPVPAAVSDLAPEAAMPPPAFGTVYRFDANGLVVPTPEGILSPEGVLLIAGRPPLVPPSRSDTATQLALAAAPAPAPQAPPETAADASLVTAGEAPVVEPAPSDPAMAGFRPRPRPEGLAPAPDDDAALTSAGTTEVVGLRPLARPANVIAAAAAALPAESETADLGAQGASLAAQAEAQLAAAAVLEAENPSIVAISRRPEARPRDLSRAVEAAVAAAVRAPEPEPAPEAKPEAAPEAEVVTAAAAPAPELKPEELDEVDEPEPAKAAPKIPTKASVAKQATFSNAINLSKMNLIGTYGTDSKRYALIRQSNGRYKKVKVGDSIDGGKVKAITATEVRYQKGGKLVTLAMPKA